MAVIFKFRIIKEKFQALILVSRFTLKN